MDQSLISPVVLHSGEPRLPVRMVQSPAGCSTSPSEAVGFRIKFTFLSIPVARSCENYFDCWIQTELLLFSHGDSGDNPERDNPERGCFINSFQHVPTGPLNEGIEAGSAQGAASKLGFRKKKAVDGAVLHRYHELNLWVAMGSLDVIGSQWVLGASKSRAKCCMRLISHAPGLWDSRSFVDCWLEKGKQKMHVFLKLAAEILAPETGPAPKRWESNSRQVLQGCGVPLPETMSKVLLKKTEDDRSF